MVKVNNIHVHLSVSIWPYNISRPHSFCPTEFVSTTLVYDRVRFQKSSLLSEREVVQSACMEITEPASESEWNVTVSPVHVYCGCSKISP